MKIFISHIHEEQEVAIGIKNQLIEIFGNQVSIWLSTQIKIGENWFKEIQQSLTNADMILVLFSLKSVNRPWINIEAGYGVMEGKRVVPICFLGLKKNSLPPIYQARQAIDLSIKDEVKGFLTDIALSTPAQRFLGDLEKSTNEFASHITKAILATREKGRYSIDMPLIWLFGSTRELNTRDRSKVIKAVDALSSVFAQNNYQVVMGTSKILNYVGDSIVENLEDLSVDEIYSSFANSYSVHGSSSPKINPIVLLGSLRSAKGLVRTFEDCIGRVPDLGILISGSIEGRSKQEYELAMMAKIPVLPLSFTGGFAAECKSTFDESLGQQIELVNGFENRMDDLSVSILELIESQIQISRGTLE